MSGRWSRQPASLTPCGIRPTTATSTSWRFTWATCVVRSTPRLRLPASRRCVAWATDSSRPTLPDVLGRSSAAVPARQWKGQLEGGAPRGGLARDERPSVGADQVWARSPVPSPLHPSDVSGCRRDGRSVRTHAPYGRRYAGSAVLDTDDGA